MISERRVLRGGDHVVVDLYKNDPAYLRRGYCRSCGEPVYTHLVQQASQLALPLSKLKSGCCAAAVDSRKVTITCIFGGGE